MALWIAMLVLVLLPPLVMLAVGCGYLVHPPKYFSRLWGYRTAMAKRSRDTWRFAQRFFGKICCWVSPAVLAASAVGMALFFGRSVLAVLLFSCILLAAQGVIFCSLIIPTEVALRRVYNKSGRIR